ncbi:MAG: pyrroline-5-carboxylate reductase [Lautropia sp.]|nr:pyrroline-5-carboxylate reductase [Lautropia sp.]
MTASADSPASSASGNTLAGRHILFIGGGNMATAMISGLVESGMPATQITVVEPVAAARQSLADKNGVAAFPDAASIGEDRQFGAIVLAVKPQQAAAALNACQGLLRRHPDTVLISIAAGLGVELLARMSSGHRRIVRAMPNTPSLIGAGISGLFAPDDAPPGDRAIAHAILASTGQVVSVDREDLIDTVTAVSGSGPAYAFYLMEAMIEAGISGGLDAAAARELALQTVKGAALLALASDEPPEVLRARVTSPAGTTAAAVAVLEQRQVKAGICEAVRAAAARSKELSDEAKAAQASAS